MTGFELRRVAELWLKGCNTQQIATQLGVPEAAIYGSVLEAALREHCTGYGTKRMALRGNQPR